MKRLIIWIIVLTVLSSGGIALTKQSGGTAPRPAFAEWFTYPDGKPCPMPCLFGIRIGITKLDEAEAILKQHPGVRITRKFGDDSDPSGRTMFLNGDTDTSGHLELVLEPDSEKTPEIEHMRLYLIGDMSGKTTFYDILLAFGYPEGVHPAAFDTGSVIGSQYEYFNETVRFSLETFRSQDLCQFELGEKVILISLYSHRYRRNHFIGAEEFYPWAGITNNTYWERYYKYKEYYSSERYGYCKQ